MYNLIIVLYTGTKCKYENLNKKQARNLANIFFNSMDFVSIVIEKVKENKK